jgi:hypothetical protein
VAHGCVAQHLDARGLRKLVVRALIRRRDLAEDPGRLTLIDLEEALSDVYNLG